MPVHVCCLPISHISAYEVIYRCNHNHIVSPLSIVITGKMSISDRQYCLDGRIYI